MVREVPMPDTRQLCCAACTLQAIQLAFRRRQFDPKCTSLPDGAFDTDLALHQLDQPLGKCQAQAGAFYIGLICREAFEGCE